MRFLYQYINPTGAKARASRNGFIGCRGPPLSQPLPSPSLSWTLTVVDRFSSPRWSTEWARLAERYIGLCRWQYQTPSTWAAAVDQQQITAAVDCAALGKEADCNYGERTAESIFFWRVGALWKSCIFLGRTRYPLLKEISPHGLVVNNIFKGEQITQCATVIEWVLCFCAVF